MSADPISAPRVKALCSTTSSVQTPCNPGLSLRSAIALLRQTARSQAVELSLGFAETWSPRSICGASLHGNKLGLPAARRCDGGNLTPFTGVRGVETLGAAQQAARLSNSGVQALNRLADQLPAGLWGLILQELVQGRGGFTYITLENLQQLKLVSCISCA